MDISLDLVAVLSEDCQIELEKSLDRKHIGAVSVDCRVAIQLAFGATPTEDADGGNHFQPPWYIGVAVATVLALLGWFAVSHKVVCIETRRRPKKK